VVNEISRVSSLRLVFDIRLCISFFGLLEMDVLRMLMVLWVVFYAYDNINIVALLLLRYSCSCVVKVDGVYCGCV
jgi:hypothetical protein